MGKISMVQITNKENVKDINGSNYKENVKDINGSTDKENVKDISGSHCKQRECERINGSN